MVLYKFLTILDHVFFKILSPYIKFRFNKQVVLDRAPNFSTINVYFYSTNDSNDEDGFTLSFYEKINTIRPVVSSDYNTDLIKLNINKLSNSLLNCSDKKSVDLINTTYTYFIVKDNGDSIFNIVNLIHSSGTSFYGPSFDYISHFTYFILDTFGLVKDFEKYLDEMVEKLKGEVVF